MNHEPNPRAARDFAVRAHGRQLYGSYPYAKHLDDVAALARPFGPLAETVAYLHDVLEDTHVSEYRLSAVFGPVVAVLVWVITDPPGKTRAERKARLYAELARRDDGFNVARIVKAADRLANLRADPGWELFQVYRLEHRALRDACYRPGLCDDLWAELDRRLR